jgi:hypothetical protein
MDAIDCFAFPYDSRLPVDDVVRKAMMDMTVSVGWWPDAATDQVNKVRVITEPPALHFVNEYLFAIGFEYRWIVFT